MIVFNLGYCGPIELNTESRKSPRKSILCKWRLT